MKKIGLVIFTLVVDSFAIITADLASFIIRFNGYFPRENFGKYRDIAVYIIVLRLTCFYVFHLYEKPKYKSNFEILINVAKATTLSSMIIIAALYFLNESNIPRSLSILSWILTIAFTMGWRFTAKQFIELYLGKNFLKSQLLIVGTNRSAAEAYAQTLRSASINYNFLGYIKIKKNNPIEVNRKEIIGSVEELPYILKQNTVDEIIITDTDIDDDELVRLINLSTKYKITIKSLPCSYEAVINNLLTCDRNALFDGPSITSKPALWYTGLKRILDIAASVLLLILAVPILAIAIFLIKCTSPGPALYLQKRTGLNGIRFTMLKLRTMHPGAEKHSKPSWAKANDKRITGVGHSLRHYRIDELPQLINVIRGEMSLIGPRPERPYFTAQLLKKIPYYAERLGVKPGITGWAQVNFRYAASKEDAEKKLMYDLYYIHNMSFALDFLIFLKTLKVVLAGEGAR